MSHLSQMEKQFDKDLVMSRILTEDSYNIIIKDTYKYFNISDKVVCFYNGIDWLIILLDDMLAYPVLYFQFWSEKDNTTYINSLVLCPITMRSMIYKGHIKILDINNNRLYIRNTDTSDEFFMDSPYTGSYDDSGVEKKIKSHVKRHEVKILTLRDTFMFLIDPKYIIINKELKHRPIIYEKYYTNKLSHEGFPLHTTIHPKTIVYMVQYYSYSMKRYRYTVIVGRDINKENVTGYSYRASGIWEFISKHIHEFIKKRAYIYPVFWFMVEKLYSDVNIVSII
jgi:hypothetical protein